MPHRGCTYLALPPRWRCVLLLALVLATGLTVIRLATDGRAWHFPKEACPDTSVGLATRHQRLPIGNWSFRAPPQLAQVCSGSTTARQLLALIPVTLAMTAERDDLRRTWGSQLNSEFGQLLFLIQLPYGKPVNSALLQEFDRSQDLLFAFYSGDNPEDTYAFLVRKVVAGLRWYASSCRRGFDFVLKADHDSYWNLPSLLRLLRRHRPSEPLVLGSVQEGAPVTRNAGSKFFTSVEAFPRPRFPPYASGGPGYAMSRAAVVGLSEVASRGGQDALWLEDVYITGLLAEAAFPACLKPPKAGRRPVTFLHLHSDYIFICRLADLSPSVVASWPPLAMHRVQGQALGRLHAWMQAPGMADLSDRLHSIVYSRSSCSDML